jgi:RNA polymerase sigma-70 factor (ECF subfamily)
MGPVENQLLENVREFTAFARKRLGDPELAADAVQESLLKALRSADGLRDEEKTKAWFYRILRRTIIDLYRRRDARERAAADLEREMRSVRMRRGSGSCAAASSVCCPVAPQYAELIRRVDLSEQQPEALATELGITKKNLNVRLHRARQQLKRHLEENCRICAAHGCLDCHCGGSQGPAL